MAGNHSFEPRIGKAQLFFGICYSVIVIIALMLAVYVKMTYPDQEPYMQYFMAVLFALLAAKSFFLYRRIKNLIARGTRAQATLLSCEAVRGITVVRAELEVPNYGRIEFEQRLAGTRVAGEINRYLTEHKQQKLPALIIAGDSRHPRAMLTVSSKGGHLIEQSLALD